MVVSRSGTSLLIGYGTLLGVWCACNCLVPTTLELDAHNAHDMVAILTANG